MEKVIIFGASGNVGSYLTHYAKDFFDNKKIKVIASGRRNTNVFEKEGIEYISLDITKKEDFEKLPKTDVKAVMLLSSATPSYMANYNPENYLMTNIMGTYNVLEYCRNVKVERLIFTQTTYDIWLYDHNEILKPDLPPKFPYSGDHAVYTISKNSAIELIKHYNAEYGLKYFIFRPGTVYCWSDYQYYFPGGEKKMRPLYVMINRALKGEDIELWGDPEYKKDMLYVYDFAQEMCKGVLTDKVDHGIYNGGTGKPVSMKEQIQAIIDVFSPVDRKSKIVYVPEKKSGGGILFDIDNARKELGYEPIYDVYTMFEDMKKEMSLGRYKELRMDTESHN